MAKKALLVGVNNYKYVRALNGCINDVRNMTDILTSLFNFSPHEIRTIVDESVTRNNLMDRLDWLIDEAKEGDVLFFHFSGHGSQVLDRNGDELEDSMDEILCLYDMDFRNSDSYLLDDDFNDIVDRLPKGVNLTVCIDSCHSGTATRDIGLLASELQIPVMKIKTQSRFIEPPSDIGLRNYGNSLKIRRLGAKTREEKRTTGYENSTANHVLLSGCMDEQTAADAFLNNDYHGAFTYYFCKTIRESGGVITYQELIKKVQNRLALNSFSQIPQLNGNQDLQKSNFLSLSSVLANSILTCTHGHPLLCSEGHPPKDYVSPDELLKKQKDSTRLQKRIQRIHISTPNVKRAISQGIILPSNSEFIGTIRDLSSMTKKGPEGETRNSLGNAYYPECLDLLESEHFTVTNLLEFRPNEQRAMNGKTVKPLLLDIRCNPGEEGAIILSCEKDGKNSLWKWHFQYNPVEDKNTTTIQKCAVERESKICSFYIPFIAQETTTRGIWSKVIYVFKFREDWITERSDDTIKNVIKKFEEEYITEGLKYIDYKEGFTEMIRKQQPISHWEDMKKEIGNGRKGLLFIHGTASSLSGNYKDVQKEILTELKSNYSLILGYDHYTLSKTPKENAIELKNILDEQIQQNILDKDFKFDVVTHSRGGLVLRSFVELLEGHHYVDKVIMVACPAKGTTLANPDKWDSIAAMLNFLSTLFSLSGIAPLKLFSGIAGGLIKFSSDKLKRPDAIPGIWSMNPQSSFIEELNQDRGVTIAEVTYNTIGSNFEPSGIVHGGIVDDMANSVADVFFGDRNDLIVDTDHMAIPWPHKINGESGPEDPKHNYTFLPEKQVHHLNYFQQEETYRKFEQFFGINLNTAIQKCFP
ncbi:MAG: caspase family protein [Candidatus Brocadiaceae bacterium]|nr:caspase family protein [Candidatus Brocadiaceae bacterium]